MAIMTALPLPIVKVVLTPDVEEREPAVPDCDQVGVPYELQAVLDALVTPTATFSPHL